MVENGKKAKYTLSYYDNTLNNQSNVVGYSVESQTLGMTLINMVKQNWLELKGEVWHKKIDLTLMNILKGHLYYTVGEYD